MVDVPTQSQILSLFTNQKELKLRIFVIYCEKNIVKKEKENKNEKDKKSIARSRILDYQV